MMERFKSIVSKKPAAEQTVEVVEEATSEIKVEEVVEETIVVAEVAEEVAPTPIEKKSGLMDRLKSLRKSMSEDRPIEAAAPVEEVQEAAEEIKDEAAVVEEKGEKKRFSFFPIRKGTLTKKAEEVAEAVVDKEADLPAVPVEDLAAEAKEVVEKVAAVEEIAATEEVASAEVAEVVKEVAAVEAKAEKKKGKRFSLFKKVIISNFNNLAYC
jgi:hypothetical protein